MHGTSIGNSTENQTEEMQQRCVIPKIGQGHVEDCIAIAGPQSGLSHSPFLPHEYHLNMSAPSPMEGISTSTASAVASDLDLRISRIADPNIGRRFLT